MRDLLELIGEQGMLLVCVFLTLPFLLPVSIPGVSTVFGLAIILIGVGVTLNRVPWLPRRILDRPLSTAPIKHAFDKADIQQPRSTVTIMERGAGPARAAPEGPPQ